VRVCAHSPIAAGRRVQQLAYERTVFIEQALGAVAAQPLLEQCRCSGSSRCPREEPDVTERAFRRLSVHYLWSRPAFR
jgi:hypothetical protein